MKNALLIMLLILMGCSSAEEKIKENRFESEREDLWLEYSDQLRKFIDEQEPTSSYLSDIAHAHPIQRAQAILMTISKTQGEGRE